MLLTNSTIKTEEKRRSGILMHISSLPSPYGIGSLGQEAKNFADFLVETGQKFWQMLPLGPTGHGDSPYQSFSTYAGNPYFIDLDILMDQGLLFEDELRPLNENINPKKVDFGRIYGERFPILKLAFSRFDKNNKKYLDFVEENSFWLDDYSLFMALKSFYEGKAWLEWEDKYKKRDKSALEKFKKDYLEEIDYYNFIQFMFFTQLRELKDYLEKSNILLIGDLPIYVAEDSADVWANPEVFKLDDDLKAEVVGGVPPDYFSKNGQLWGNPIYDWEHLEKTDYKWWVDRVKWNNCIFDILRFDHFRGFESFWEIPAGEETAKNGKWAKGPGMKLFDKLKEELGEILIIAEDLGDLTEEVEEFVRESGYPGMNVLLFAFGIRGDSEYLPHNTEKNSVMYVGTHDNDTIIGWLRDGDPNEVEFAREYLNLTLDETYNWGLIRGALTSPSNTCIIQMQDILLLDNSARMNEPGTMGENWTWRMTHDEIGPLTKSKLEKLTRISGRFNKSQEELKREKALEEALEIAKEEGLNRERMLDNR